MLHRARHCRQASSLVKAKDDIGALDCLARSALAQIVDGARRHQHARALVEREANLGSVGADDRSRLGLLAGIEHEYHLISPEALTPIQTVKVKHLGSNNPRIHSDETLIALAISAAADPVAAKALAQLSKLRGCEAHSTVILSQVDNSTYSKLGMHLTTEPQYETNKLYHR